MQSATLSTRCVHILVSERDIAWVPPRLQNLRSWPVAGFEVIRIYYLVDQEAIHVIRVLHGKRDLKSVLERDATT
jgi:plasmid stabilization system protein ParE